MCMTGSNVSDDKRALLVSDDGVGPPYEEYHTIHNEGVGSRQLTELATETSPLHPTGYSENNEV